MKLIVLLVLTLTLSLIAVTTAHSKDPGLRIAVSSKGLDYVQKTGISILEGLLSNTVLPDLTGKVKLNYKIGHITLHWTVSKLHIDTLSIPVSSLTPSQSGLTFKASQISVTVKGHIHTSNSHHDIIHVSASTDMTVSLYNASFDVGVLLTRDSRGHPVVSTTECSASVSSVHHKFHGGSKWVYKTVDHIEDFDHMLSKNFQPAFCKGVKNAINHHGNQMLQNIPLTVPINKLVEVNYALTDAPLYSDQYIAIDYSGEFQLISDPQDPPFSPPSLPPPSNEKDHEMMSIWFTDYIANTAGLVYHESGMLSYNITPDSIPQHSPLTLNTSSFRLILPALFKAYPNMGIILSIKTTKPPHFQIDSKAVSLLLASEVNVFVESSTVAPHLVATLGLTGSLKGDLWIEHHHGKVVMCGNATSLDFEFSVISSTVGTLDVKGLNQVMTKLGEPILMEFINMHGRSGLEIPMADGIELTKSKVMLGEGYLRVVTDIKYNV